MKNVIILLAMLTLNSAYADRLCIFAPDSDVKVGKSKKDGVKKEDVDKAIKDVMAVYAPIVKSQFNAKLRILNSWSNDTANAFASRKTENGESIFHVEYLGGLARHEANNIDAVYAVLCHEVGHHIGGAPRKKMVFGKTLWASNEGQSDYWATLKCLRRVFKNKNNFEIMKAREELHADKDATDKMKSKSPVNKTAKEKCNLTFKSKNEQSLCYRAAMAGYSTARLLKSLSGKKDLPEFETPSKGKVSKTNHSHPKPQCRLDTYFAGAICDIDFNVDVDMDDANIGACSTTNGDSEGIRPVCWYSENQGGGGSGSSW